MNNEHFYDSYQYGNTSNREENKVVREEDTSTREENTYEYSGVNFVMRDPVVEEQPPKKKKQGKGKKWVLCVSMAIVFGIVASIVFQASNFLIESITGKTPDSNKTVLSTQITTGNGSAIESDIAKVAENVMPSVVSITNLSVQEVQMFFFGGTVQQEYESSGSGVIIGQNDTELLIVSNNHVVEESKSLTVTFHDGSSVEAKIKGTDSDIDLAILAVPLDKISDDTKDIIKMATVGDSDKLSVGEPAIAIGNALGYGQSVTSGIVSALKRQLGDSEVEYIQTDAAINPGNSGGALLNAKGEVIGINTAKLKDEAVEGMGYAIPISDVSDVLNDLMNRETKTKVPEAKQGALGISGVTVDEASSDLYGIPEGALVREVIEGGAAEEAGLPKGCIITKVNSSKVDSMEELQDELSYYEAGEKVELTVQVPSESGDYVEKTYEVKLMNRQKLK